MAKRINTFLEKIHHSDCIAGLKEVPARSVDLAFADPPFNIGFKYDEYDDQLESEQYLDWSHDWISQIHRVLKENGTFWLAIGDEYAAELKIASQKIGFHCRSWVIWYYTFGVNCKMKFTRSHAHLFHFVKDKNDFVFNHDDLDLRVPSARQLVYNDKRANPKGRLPDDTWILRPQDLTGGFNPDEDTWHFPRVAGTFKERAGFHGCQMPEQLLGRIIRACSHKNDIVLDPFSGSSTTLAVAKKMHRKFFGFELSRDYVKLGTQRLERISAGDRLNGSEEPQVSALRTDGEKTKKRSTRKNRPKKSTASPQLPLFSEGPPRSDIASQADRILEAFSDSNQGYSVDRLIADPVLNENFQHACEHRSASGTPSERNRILFHLRKTGKFKSAGITTNKLTNINWPHISPFVFASEIAWRQIDNRQGAMGLEEMFCDPDIAAQFDRIAEKFAPGHQSLDYRWAALKFNKEFLDAKHRAKSRTAEELEIQNFQTGVLGDSKSGDSKSVPLATLNIADIPPGPGVYLVQQSDGQAIYAGETEQLQSQFELQFGALGPRATWAQQGDDLRIHVLPVATTLDFRFARQWMITQWHQPCWNRVENPAILA